MVTPKQYWVYILTNKGNKVLYTGVTGNLTRRLAEHLEGRSKFTAKYHVNKLVYAETYQDVDQALSREKQIKGGSRQKKIELIKEVNPYWRDLSGDLW
ncbi:MAG: GIY-YIG nuclease family protein [Proteobacteria bacterium]|nr:GIY-YIG nuclease family protein [Pseudomonadota bacterium]MBU4277853.1 GIY-YIG nuclease family protein [Pseudomonadota bacterium]MBU4385259.1 GIY-YIG nuclease family protein [Pseudomonadota bacterium]MCG2764867.1 GIY-YIG nuclease family protein [Desulfarculaceae bacterium]